MEIHGVRTGQSASPHRIARVNNEHAPRKLREYFEQLGQIPVQEGERVLTPGIIASWGSDDRLNSGDDFAARTDLACEHPSLRAIETLISLIELDDLLVGAR